MSPASVFDVFKQVITSWQVLAVTVVIVIYFHIVSHVAKSYHRPRTSRKIKIDIFKKKKAKTEVPIINTEEPLPESDSNDDLGLEEAS